MRLLSSLVALPALFEGTCSCWLRHDSRKTVEGEDEADEDDEVDDDADEDDDVDDDGDGGDDDDDDGDGDDDDDNDDEETAFTDLLLLPLLPPLLAGGAVGACCCREPVTMTAKCEK